MEPITKNDLQIVIMSRNRLALLRECIQSIIGQDDTEFQFVVSDNSDDSEVYDYIRSNHPQITIRRRAPVLPALDHFNTIMDECTSRYIVIFHDDDMLTSDYVRKIKAAWLENPTCVAIGCNARILRDGNLLPRKFFKSGAIEIENQKVLLSRYSSLTSDNMAPFPSYCYDAQILKNHRPKIDLGKFMDLILLMELLTSGSIYWLSDCCMYYRVHSTNDSGADSIHQRQKVLSYVCSLPNIHRREKVVRTYRFKYLIRIAIASIRYSRKGWIARAFETRNRLIILLKVYFFLRLPSIFRL
jgi:glycosyltransferase involved in cell wall biosynthesis